MQKMPDGVLAPSKTYFTSPDASAPRWFLNLMCTGLFICDGSYALSRMNYESGLIMLVLEGRGYVVHGSYETVLRAGDLCLLDCFTPHAYGTRSGWRILWAHFSGASAKEICSSIEDGVQVLHPREDGPLLHRQLRALYDQFENGAHLDSAQIHTALTSLIVPFFSRASTQNESAGMDRIAAYISEHLADGVSNTELAQLAHMSESQLIRMFRRQKGATPHKYLLDLRLRAAQYYLVSTDMSIAQVAAQCGFTDASALTNSFRQAYGVTPREYALRNAPPAE